MLSFARRDHVLENIGHVIRFVDSSLLSPGNERYAYLTCLNKIQRLTFPMSDEPDEILYDFDLQDHRALEIAKYFMDVHGILPEHIFSPDERQIVLKRMGEAFHMVRDFDAEYAEVIRLLVGCFIFARKRGFGGASFGECLGAIWLSPSPKWETIDFAESIIHESIHQANFLDIMVRGMYSVHPHVMEKDDALVISAIRKTKRPYHLALDSIWVAAALMRFYESQNLPAKAVAFCTPMLPTLAELKQQEQHFLTAYGQGRLRELDEFVRASRTFRQLSK